MDIVLMGAPGAGKGTQAAKLEKELGLKHISTGDVLREEIASGSELGKRVAAIIDGGDLVSDELMVSILKNIVAGTDKGIIFDGFPRTVPQAQMLDDMLKQLGRKLGKAVAIELPEEERRAMGERGRQLIIDHYSVDVVASQMKAVYEWLMGGVKPDCVYE